MFLQLVGLADISPHTKESSELLYKNKLTLFRILYLQPKKLHLCVIDTELLAAMQFARMILSENKDQRTLAIDFCSFLLYHDKNLTLGELVGYDQKSRDYILKHDFIKVRFEHVNQLSIFCNQYVGKFERIPNFPEI